MWRARYYLDDTFTSDKPRHCHVLYATNEIIRRAVMPRYRYWKPTDYEFFMDKLKKLCTERRLPSGIVDKEAFRKYWLWLHDILRILKCLKPYFDTEDPCILRGFISRKKSTEFLNDQRVKTGTFILRFSSQEKKSIIVSWKNNSGRPNRVTHQELFHGLDRDGSLGFSESSRSHANTNYYTLKELIMQTKHFKYVYWHPDNHAEDNLAKKFCFEESFVPG